MTRPGGMDRLPGECRLGVFVMALLNQTAAFSQVAVMAGASNAAATAGACHNFSLEWLAAMYADSSPANAAKRMTALGKNKGGAAMVTQKVFGNEWTRQSAEVADKGVAAWRGLQFVHDIIPYSTYSQLNFLQGINSTDVSGMIFSFWFSGSAVGYRVCLPVERDRRVWSEGSFCISNAQARARGTDRCATTRLIDPKSSSIGAGPQLLANGSIDAVFVGPHEAAMFREKKIGHVLVNTTTDKPWSQYFCCMIASTKEFVHRNPVATKRAVRALLKATDLCASDPEGVARLLIERNVPQFYDWHYDKVLQEVKDIPYGQWREFDPEDWCVFTRCGCAKWK